MIATVARWELQRMRYESPGPSGLLALVVFPLLCVVPWERLGLFSSAFQAVLTLGWVYAVVLASSLSADAGELNRGLNWLHQKGVSLPDYALARWILAVASGVAFNLAGLLFAAAGVAYYDDLQLRQVIVYIGSAVLIFVVATAVYFVLGALRLKRKSELLLLYFLLALTQSLWFRDAPQLARRALHVLLPPVMDAATAPSALLDMEWRQFTAGSLHTLLFVAGCLALSFVLHRRWRPFG